MSTFNKIFLLGNLVHNPEYKILESGKKICNFRIASSDTKNNVTFINVVAFDKLADTCQKWIKKGSKVLVDGKLNYRQVNYNEYYEIFAKGVQFIHNIKTDEPNENIDAPKFDKITEGYSLSPEQEQNKPGKPTSTPLKKDADK